MKVIRDLFEINQLEIFSKFLWFEHLKIHSNSLLILFNSQKIMTKSMFKTEICKNCTRNERKVLAIVTTMRDKFVCIVDGQISKYRTHTIYLNHHKN